MLGKCDRCTNSTLVGHFIRLSFSLWQLSKLENLTELNGRASSYNQP